MSNNSLKLKKELAALKRLHALKLINCYSADSLDSAPTEEQQRFINDITNTLIRWVVASNQSGKTTGGAREVAWLFDGTHPTFDVKAKWGDVPLKIIILSKKSSIIEDEIWSQKIKPLLTTAWKIKRGSGGVLAGIENIDNGNVIIFQSHNNPAEARKNIQGHTAHYVWIDEMPEDDSLISELALRIIAKDGRLVGTFTPLIFNQNVRKIIDQAKAPSARRYFFSLFDNPGLKHRIEEVIEGIRQTCATEEEFNCRVHGKWMTAGKAVSVYIPEKHKESLPEYYSPVGWRHLGIVDPAASGLAGVTVWAEDPKTGTWYNVLAKYVEGSAPSVQVTAVEELFLPFKLYERICDCNPAGFYKEAEVMGISYRPIAYKSNRKHELIDKTNEFLLKGKAKLTEQSEVLEDELITCAWSETNPGTIIKASRFHCFDTFQYAMDLIPSLPKPEKTYSSHEEQIKAAWGEVVQQRIAQQKAKKQSSNYRVFQAGRSNSAFDRIKRSRQKGRRF